MGVVDLGKVRGTQIYTGKYVTGTSAIGAVFENTGITKAYAGDIYINTDSTSDSNGNVYECTLAGDSATAKWSYQGNIRGPKIGTVNNLKSTSTEDALSAYQGKRLLDMMKEAGVFGKQLIVEYDITVYGIKLTIDNVNTVITLTVDGEEYTYTYSELGSSERNKVSITLGNNIGMQQNGGVITEVKSSSAYIYSYELTNSSYETIYAKNVELWSTINEAVQGSKITGSVVDGEETVKTGNVYKFLNGVKKIFYPITHAKAVWFNKEENKTVYDALSDALKEKDNFEITGSVVDGEETVDTGNIYKLINGVKKILYPITHAKAVWFDKVNNKTVHDAICGKLEETDVVDPSLATEYGFAADALKVKETISEQNKNILTLEEINSSTDLSGKIASASALKDYDNRRYIQTFFTDQKVNDLGGFEKTVKYWIDNYTENNISYVGLLTIGTAYTVIGHKYSGGNYGAFLLIGFSNLVLAKIYNGVFSIREI